MGRGEIPVELCQQPSVLPLLLLINLQTMKGVNLCKKIEPLKTNSPRQYGDEKKIGNTTFTVNSFFLEQTKDGVVSKIERLIKDDVRKKAATI